MCGLLGHVVMAGCGADAEAVRQGNRALVHRGPDGGGQVDLGQCSLAHRRLSVIDLEGSPQPWRSECGRYHLVFNGEIYNYRALRKELEQRGYRFRSDGDTEVLLNLYIEHGESCLEKLNGMFAFAVWDSRERLLFMARDRLGEKPLYYARSSGQLAFASELVALGGFDFVDRGLDTRAVDDFFAHQYIGEDRTIYKGIRKLRPAHWLRWREGRVETGCYWTLPRQQLSTAPVAQLCEELEWLVRDSVNMRLHADVPLGMFLSGGLDSSLVAYTVRELGHDPQAFTIGFSDSSYDESRNARAVARALALRQQTEVVDLGDVQQLNEILDAFGEPYADPSAIPTWTLCRFARQEVTVALSGDGVDELFGGYRRYYARSLLQRLPMHPRYLKNRLVERLVGLFPESSAYYGNSLTKKLRLFYGLISRLVESPGDPLAQTFSLGERQRLLGDDRVSPSGFELLGKLDIEGLDAVSQMMFADQMTYLPEDILVKVDRMSMQHGLEVRNPFLDHRLAEFAARLPLELKIRGKVQKYLVRHCYRENLPPESVQRAKHGFSVPLGRWFREGLKTPFENQVLDGKAVEDMLDRKEVLGMWEQHQRGQADFGFKLWSIYVFCRWYHRYTEA